MYKKVAKCKTPVQTSTIMDKADEVFNYLGSRMVCQTFLAAPAIQTCASITQRILYAYNLKLFYKERSTMFVTARSYI